MTYAPIDVKYLRLKLFNNGYPDFIYDYLITFYWTSRLKRYYHRCRDAEQYMVLNDSRSLYKHISHQQINL